MSNINEVGVIPEDSKVLIITHTDMDGHVSGGLAFDYFSRVVESPYNVKIRCTNYNQGFDVESEVIDEEYDIVCVLDFSLDNTEDLKKINSKSKLIWIDHHTVIDQVKEDFFGLRRQDVSAAHLVWEYFHPHEDVPASVKLVSDYDTWKWEKNGDTTPLYFSQGFMVKVGFQRLMDDDFVNNLLDPEWVADVVLEGKARVAINRVRNKYLAEAGAFPTEICGIKAVAINYKNSNSTIFESVNERYKDRPLRILYGMCGGNTHRITLYSLDPDNYPVDSICKRYGGGGHRGAAGCSTIGLPFKRPLPTAANDIDIVELYNNLKIENVVREAMLPLADEYVDIEWEIERLISNIKNFSSSGIDRYCDGVCQIGEYRIRHNNNPYGDINDDIVQTFQLKNGWTFAKLTGTEWEFSKFDKLAEDLNATTVNTGSYKYGPNVWATRTVVTAIKGHVLDGYKPNEI